MRCSATVAQGIIEIQLSLHQCSATEAHRYQIAKCTTSQQNLCCQHQSLNAIWELSFKMFKDLCNRNPAGLFETKNNGSSWDYETLCQTGSWAIVDWVFKNSQVKKSNHYKFINITQLALRQKTCSINPKSSMLCDFADWHRAVNFGPLSDGTV